MKTGCANSLVFLLLVLIVIITICPINIVAQDSSSDPSNSDSTILSSNIDCLPNFTDTISLIMKIVAACLLYLAIGVMIIFLPDVKLGFLVGWIIFIQQLVSTGANAIAGLKWSGIVGTIIANIYLILGVVNLDVTYVKEGCNVPAYSFITFYWATIIFFVIIIGVFTICSLIHAFRIKQSQLNELKITRFQAWKKRQLHALFMFGALIYLQATQRSFRALACDNKDGVSVLIIENSVQCWEGSHYGVAIFSIIFLLAFSVGFPLLCLYYLRKIWSPRLKIMKLKEKQEQQLQSQLKQLQMLQSNKDLFNKKAEQAQANNKPVIFIPNSEEDECNLTIDDLLSHPEAKIENQLLDKFNNLKTPRSILANAPKLEEAEEEVDTSDSKQDWNILQELDKKESGQEFEWNKLETQAQLVRETNAKRNVSVMKAASKLKTKLNRIRKQHKLNQSKPNNINTRQLPSGVPDLPNSAKLRETASDDAAARSSTNNNNATTSSLPAIQHNRSKSDAVKSLARPSLISKLFNRNKSNNNSIIESQASTQAGIPANLNRTDILKPMPQFNAVNNLNENKDLEIHRSLSPSHSTSINTNTKRVQISQPASVPGNINDVNSIIEISEFQDKPTNTEEALHIHNNPDEDKIIDDNINQLNLPNNTTQSINTQPISPASISQNGKSVGSKNDKLDPLIVHKLYECINKNKKVLVPESLIQQLVDPATAQDFYFLYRGCRPQTYWYRNMNFLVNFTLALQSSFSRNASVQTFVAGFIFLAYFTSAGLLKPYRSTFENYNALIGGSINTFQCLLFLLLIAISSIDTSNAPNIAYTAILLFTIVLCVFIVILYRNQITIRDYFKLILNDPRKCFAPCAQHIKEKKLLRKQQKEQEKLKNANINNQKTEQNSLENSVAVDVNEPTPEPVIHYENDNAIVRPRASLINKSDITLENVNSSMDNTNNINTTVSNDSNNIDLSLQPHIHTQMANKV